MERLPHRKRGEADSSCLASLAHRNDKSPKEKANLISQTGLYLCRQLEALRRRERAFFAREPSAEILSVLCEGSREVRYNPAYGEGRSA
jgi:hypothetical protein